MQERCNSIANTLKLRLSCTNPTMCCGIWQWTTLNWCYSTALEVAPLVQLSNTRLKGFIVKYHNAICSWLYCFCIKSMVYVLPLSSMHCILVFCCCQLMIDFNHKLRGYINSTGTIIWWSQCHWSKPYWGWDKMAGFSQMTLSIAFSSMKTSFH